MEMVKLEIRDMLFETDPATAVAKHQLEHQHKRSKTVASKDLANKNRNITEHEQEVANNGHAILSTDTKITVAEGKADG